MQGSGEILNFFAKDTFSVMVNPTNDNAVPLTFRARQTKVDIKSRVNMEYLRYFMVTFTM